MSSHVTRRSQDAHHPATTDDDIAHWVKCDKPHYSGNHAESKACHDPMKARRIGEASHPGPQHYSTADITSDDDDGFGDGFTDMEWEDDMREMDSEAFQQPPDECLSEYSHYADSGHDPDPDDEAATALQTNNNSASNATRALETHADPLPGHPAGNQWSEARKASLNTWTILSQWVKIPTRPAKKTQANAVKNDEAPNP